MLTIKKIDEVNLSEVSLLSVNSEQLPFVGEIEDILKNKVESSHYHVIVYASEVVGFFNIDTAYNKHYDFSLENEIGLRSFLIDSNHQGKGYGKLAALMLKDYLSQNYSQYDSIVLTVNCKNPGAYHCYQSGGFLDTNELYLGGAAGPQHIMRLSLNGD